MPHDYAIWHAIDQKMVGSAPSGIETKAEYVARMGKAARSLPRSYVRKVLTMLKANIQGVIDAGGYHAKSD